MPIRPEDVPKIAFKTRWGLYEFFGTPIRSDQCPSAVYEHDERPLGRLLGQVRPDFSGRFVNLFPIYRGPCRALTPGSTTSA